MSSIENGQAKRISRRRLLKGGAVLGAIAAGPGVSLLAPTSSHADTAKVVIQYDWLMGNGQIGDIVAVHNGYFKDQGLEVEMSPGGPNSATLAPVVSGQAQLGQFSGVSQLLLARSAGAPVSLFATGYQQRPSPISPCPRLRCTSPRIFTASGSESSRPPAPRSTL